MDAAINIKRTEVPDDDNDSDDSDETTATALADTSRESSVQVSGPIRPFCASLQA